MHGMCSKCGLCESDCLKQRKSNTLTGVVQVGFAHTSVAGSLDAGMLDQKAPVELDVATGEGEDEWAIVLADIADAVPIFRRSCT